jgi:ceramide glucosyltransferase
VLRADDRDAPRNPREDRRPRAFAHHLAEDHAIGEAVRAGRREGGHPPFAISHACVETSLAKLVAHELRWSRTIRAVDPAGHLGSALVHRFAFALLAVVLSGAPPGRGRSPAPRWPRGSRLKLRWTARCGSPVRDLWLLPPWDLVSFAIFAASFCSRSA